VERNHWTDQQIALLREHYPHKPLMDLKKIIGRKGPSIYNKAFALGLKKSAEYLASELS
jgi:hypothetical protein